MLWRESSLNELIVASLTLKKCRDDFVTNCPMRQMREQNALPALNLLNFWLISLSKYVIEPAEDMENSFVTHFVWLDAQI